MYDHYFTGSDVNVYLRYPFTDKSVLLDKALGLGYIHNMSSSPVYVLGDVEPVFFTRGNSLVQGNLDLAFKTVKYLKTGINHLLAQSSVNQEYIELRKIMSNPNIKPTKEQAIRYGEIQNEKVSSMETISISGLFHEFEIIISFDNMNSNTPGTSSSLVLEGVKFISEGLSIYSTEESALVDRVSFLAKNIREY